MGMATVGRVELMDTVSDVLYEAERRLVDEREDATSSSTWSFPCVTESRSCPPTRLTMAHNP